MLELWRDGAGTTTRGEDTTKETVCTHLVSKVRARAKAKSSETAEIVDHLDITKESAPTHTIAKAEAWDSNDNVKIC